MAKKFVTQVILSVFIAISIIGILNFIIDPFNLNKVFNLNLPKDKVSYIMHYRLYKMIEFLNSPKSNIILGDSRTDGLKVEYFNELGVADIYNFAYGGGTLYEEIDTFWFAIQYIKPEKVIISVPFNLFNENNTKNMVKESESMIKNPLEYYFNSFILKASLLNLYTKLTGKMWRTERPAMNKEAFWTYQLGTEVTGRYYNSFIYPIHLLDCIKKISDYGEENNIELQFFIPPTHVELQNKVNEYGIQKYYEDYKKELARYSEVIDFDYPNEVTINKDNFKDPYHANENIEIKIVNELVEKTKTFSRRYGVSAH